MQGKHDKVITTLQKMAATNKKSLPDLLPNAKIEVTVSTENVTLYLESRYHRPNLEDFRAFILV